MKSTKHRLILPLFAFLLALTSAPLRAAEPSAEAEGLKTETVSQGVASRRTGEGNQPQRVEEFRDYGLGMFIHWSVDCPYGSVISHHLVGSEKAYQDRFFTEAPGFFDPEQFNPKAWAKLAKLAGMKYMVFTAKHHAGFCMWDTATTDFKITNTPYKKDITRELFDAFRAEGLRIGVYLSPDDFWMLHKQGHPITRSRPEADPRKNPELMAHNLAQLKELLTNYGPIDMVFFDGEPDQLKQLAWKIDPRILVTRGEMKTPEQYLPKTRMDEPWEANFTMGTEWPFKPTNETYKSGTELIKMLVEVRAKGGNLLLNIGPEPDGVIPFEQSRRMRELALWMLVNRESIYEVRPWVVTNEGSLWFTHSKQTDTLYAIETKLPWQWGTWREFVIKSAKATDKTEIEVVGQTGESRSWSKETFHATWKQEADGLHVKAMFGQRLYTNCAWPNPIVIRLRHVEAVQPPETDSKK
jgi:alpha-L-fucosidase